jgi:phospho-N-acetylmuramoyl-pentapeptide-transferase
MLYHLLYPLHVHAGLHGLNVLRYVSTRIIAATLTALAISFLMGPWFIDRLRSKQIGEQIRTDGPQTHKKKAGTPTMGGSLILFALVIPTLLWCDLTNRFVWLTLLVTIGYGVVGFIDDYRKLTRSKKGISARSKMAAQIIIATVAVVYLFYSDLYDVDLKLRVALPLVDFYKHPLALWLPAYLTLAIIVVVGTSNGVNMTDGLDGLAIGPVIFCAATFLILSYGAGTVIKGFNIAEYLKIPYIHGSGELAIFCGAMIGAGTGFLWFNT